MTFQEEGTEFVKTWWYFYRKEFTMSHFLKIGIVGFVKLSFYLASFLIVNCLLDLIDLYFETIGLMVHMLFWREEG